MAHPLNQNNIAHNLELGTTKVCHFCFSIFLKSDFPPSRPRPQFSQVAPPQQPSEMQQRETHHLTHNAHLSTFWVCSAGHLDILETSHFSTARYS